MSISADEPRSSGPWFLQFWGRSDIVIYVITSDGLVVYKVVVCLLKSQLAVQSTAVKTAVFVGGTLGGGSFTLRLFSQRPPRGEGSQYHMG